MKQSVRDAFVSFNAKFEGSLSYMYLDVLGLVTTGVGNLIDPINSALGLPWLKTDGTPATRVEIAQEWHTVKSHSEMKLRGGGAFAKLTSLHLAPEGIAGLVAAKMTANELILKNRFPDFDSWPADAQLGLLSMAWAMGAEFHFPKFENACHVKDFKTAALQSHMDDTHNPGLKPRNAANLVLFNNAAKVSTMETLIYPIVL